MPACFVNRSFHKHRDEPNSLELYNTLVEIILVWPWYNPDLGQVRFRGLP